VTQTAGDWHTSAIDWTSIRLWDSETSALGTWGINEMDIPVLGTRPIANHVRACLDLVEKGYFSSAQGMRADFICNETYTPVVFEKVWELRTKPNWRDIDRFMGREYLCDWLDYKFLMAFEKVGLRHPGTSL
jgi:hypothetical protein